MYSAHDTSCEVGFPIRTSADQRSLASPRGFSQRATSFIASWRQGIHRTPLSRSISHHHRPHAGPNRPATEQSRNTNRSAHTQPTGHAHRPLTLPSNPSSLVKEHSPARTPAGSNAMRRSWKRISRSQAMPDHPAANRRTPRTTHRAISHDALAPSSPTHHVTATNPEPRTGRSGGKRIRTCLLYTSPSPRDS